MAEDTPSSEFYWDNVVIKVCNPLFGAYRSSYDAIELRAG